MAGKKAAPADNSWQDRVIAEKVDLDEKVGKLIEFIDSAAFAETSPYEQNLLVRQKEIMQDYSRVLDQRIATFQHGV